MSSNANSIAQKFKYNGVEHEEALGLNLYEMEFRQYDPAIARFTSIDPVVHYSLSTYNGFDNNPVFFADPSGADGEHYNWDTGRYEDEEGNEVSFETAMASVGLNSNGSEKSDSSSSPSDWYLNLKTGGVEQIEGSENIYGKIRIGGDGASIGDIQDTLTMLGFENCLCEKDGVMGIHADTEEAYNSFVKAHNAEVLKLTKGLMLDYGLVFGGNMLFPIRTATAIRGAATVKGGSTVIEGYTITKTVANNLATRPYINSPGMIKYIMSTGKGTADKFFKGGMNWKVPGTFNGSAGIYELGINPETKVIYHFLFKSVK